MKYTIQAEILEKYPNLRVGVVVGDGLRVGNRNRRLTEIIRSNIATFLASPFTGDLQSHPNIAAWREAYSSFGVKPKKHKPTAEALLRRVLKGDEFPRINDAVDAYLAVELLHYIPIGGYDLSRVRGDIRLKISQGGEEFHPIGGGETELTEQGEVVYCDSASVLTRRWNYRDADHAKITENSTKILLATEAVYPTISADDLRGTVDKICEYAELACGGNYRTYFLDGNTVEVTV